MAETLAAEMLSAILNPLKAVKRTRKSQTDIPAASTINIRIDRLVIYVSEPEPAASPQPSCSR